MIKFKPCQKVKVLNDIRNDGTCSGCRRGNIILKAGSVGFVRELGEFLNLQVIYVHFLEDDKIVGLREDELEILEDFDEDTGRWIPV
ncbi:MAG: nitrogen fixation protein NifZ [Deferribacteres bacterium]|jgi:nitrogen fixation protein NifZ|nr:NifZ family protein [Deferribacteraceae bacterium]MDK2792221.1 nitrogen fixation protein NifZ [Deferribacteres bacterium]